MLWHKTPFLIYLNVQEILNPEPNQEIQLHPIQESKLAEVTTLTTLTTKTATIILQDQKQRTQLSANKTDFGKQMIKTWSSKKTTWININNIKPKQTNTFLFTTMIFHHLRYKG